MNFIQCALDRTMSQHFNARFHKCFGTFFASVRLWKVQNLRKNMSKTMYIQVKIWSRRNMIFSKSTKSGLNYCQIISMCRAMLTVILKDSLESKDSLSHAYCVLKMRRKNFETQKTSLVDCWKKLFLTSDFTCWLCFIVTS